MRLPGGKALWAAYRSRQLEKAYDERSERYARLAHASGFVYEEDRVAADVRARLHARGYHPPTRIAVHTFAFIPRLGWHHALIDELQQLGPVTEFDYVARGFRLDDFLRADRPGIEARRHMNALVLPAVKAAMRERPIDWVFVYANGVEISATTVRSIQDELGLPVVNMCLDDKQSWEGPWMGDHRAGQIDLAPAFDISWTSARVACEWYLVEGGRPVYLPEGFTPSIYEPRDVTRDMPVSFIGAAYGYRPAVIQFLRDRHIDVHTFGSGWTGGGWADDPVDILNRSQINLGMGGIGYSESLTNVKARDFEIPGTGGGMYLTTFNPDLAQHFTIGEEIVCYRNRAELVELIRHYLARPSAAREVAIRGRARCLREHRWLHRFRHLCRILGILEPDAAQPS